MGRTWDSTRLAARIQTVEDARYLARRRLPAALFQSFEGGSGSNLTARRNAAAFEEIMFKPRAGVYEPGRDLSRTVLGHRVSMPVLTSCVGLLGLGHPDGEPGVARASGAAGTIQLLSGATARPVEEVVAAASGPVFYQLYYFGGRESSAPIIERVRRAGCAGLVLTMDAAASISPRDRPYRERADPPAGFGRGQLARFAPQLLRRPAWTSEFLRSGRRPQMSMALGADGEPLGLFEAFGEIFAQTPAWEDLPWIRERWDGPIVIKGVLTVDDARRAVNAGAAAVVVSNHGGNALDGSMSTMAALPPIVDAVGDEIEVLVDGGIRRGTDVVKALALGARAVLLGRAYVYAHLAAGEAGVSRILEVFRAEIDAALAYLGCASIDELDRGLLTPAAAPSLAGPRA